MGMAAVRRNASVASVDRGVLPHQHCHWPSFTVLACPRTGPDISAQERLYICVTTMSLISDIPFSLRASPHAVDHCLHPY